MNRQKSYFFNYFLWKNIFLISTGLCAVLLGLNFNSNPVSAAYIPTLSASVNNMNLQINGNQVINSASQTKEIPLSLTVNTNNKTGYTITLNSETDENALVNANSATNAKINSISSTSVLNNFSNNTWGVKFGANSNFSPIPKLTSPANIAQTTTKTNGNETTDVKLGMKLGNNLESGSYKNKLIFSILTNRYDPIAKMTTGLKFNAKLKSLETTTNKIEHFKKSTTAPVAAINAINIEDPESDYEIKLWLDPTDKTAYYYTEPEKVYLNEQSSDMFSRNSNENKIGNIKDLDISNFDTSKVTQMSGMFSGMSSLTSLDLSNFNTSKVWDMDSMFRGMSSLTSLNLSNFDTSQVTDMGNMFLYASSLTSLNLLSFNTSKVTNMGSMFNNASSLISLNLSNFDTSNVTDMSAMFHGTSNLVTLDLSNFNTSNVTNITNMFSDMSNLTTLDLSNFDTSRVTNMEHMFSNMRNLTTLNLLSFNTAKVTNMSAMFAGLPNLATLNLSSFDTSNVIDMSGMFYEASNLSVLNLSNFNTSKVTNMEAMFYNMVSLTLLDLSSFNTTEVTKMSNMFSLSDAYKPNDKLEKIYVNNDFDTSKLAEFSDMLQNRKKLRGGNGSYLPNPSTADKTWLRVDRPGVQGYFTRKP